MNALSEAVSTLSTVTRKEKEVTKTPTIRMVGKDYWLNLAKGVTVNSSDNFIKLLNSEDLMIAASLKENDQGKASLMFAIHVVKGSLARHIGNLWGYKPEGEISMLTSEKALDQWAKDLMTDLQSVEVISIATEDEDPEVFEI